MLDHNSGALTHDLKFYRRTCSCLIALKHILTLLTTGAKEDRSAHLPGVTTLFDIDQPNSDVIDKENKNVAG